MGKFQDLTGKRFGRWIVLKRSGYDKNKNIKWLCRCDCGTIKEVLGSVLKSGNSFSCGCYQKETHVKIHGMTNTRLYKIWENIQSRCFNPKHDAFHKYGGRGIKVCDEWLKFEPFMQWALTHGHKNNLTIDRIDVNGNYEPNNCRWTTPKIQARNTRFNHNITYKDETHCISEWAEILDIPRSTLFYKLKKNNWRFTDDLRRNFTKNVG